MSLSYNFKVIAYNYNTGAASLASDVTPVKACVKPSAFARPTKMGTSTSTISINWNEPQYNGGCSILGYAVMVDDGDTGTFIEANVENDALVRYKPSLSQL